MRRALGFLSIAGRAATPGPGALVWFPLVGALIGLAVGGTWWAAAEVWPPAVAAAVALTVDLVLTGGLHFDGLVDSADGLLPPLASVERRLAVMADPAAGAFGVAAGVSFLALRGTALASQKPSVWLVAGTWAASRTIMAVVIRTCRPARPGGLAAAMAGGGDDSGSTPAAIRAAPVAAVGVALAATLAVAGRGWVGLAALAALTAAAAGVVALARRRIGGYSGDALGAAGVVGETAGLLVGALRW